jgi:hypothetical protein
MIKNFIGISGVVSEIICLSDSQDHTCADESSVIDGLRARYNVTKSEAQIAIGSTRDLGIIERNKDGKLKIINQLKIKSIMDKHKYDDKQGTCPKNVCGLYDGSVKMEHELSIENTKLWNAFKEIIYEVSCLPDSPHVSRVIDIINKTLNKPGNLQVDGNENNSVYKRGKKDGQFGHPPAEATEEYLRGYVDGRR